MKTHTQSRVDQADNRALVTAGDPTAGVFQRRKYRPYSASGSHYPSDEVVNKPVACRTDKVEEEDCIEHSNCETDNGHPESRA